MPLIEFINVEWIYSTNKLREFRESYASLNYRNAIFSSLILIALIRISMFMLLRKKNKLTLPVVLAASLNLLNTQIKLLIIKLLNALYDGHFNFKIKI